MAKRSDYISWDEYFMGVAILAAQRSKDPNTQSGIKAVIYRDDLYKDTKEVKASKRMLKTAGVDIIEYQSTGRVLEITL